MSGADSDLFPARRVMRERSGLVMVQRDEGALLGANVAYHLAAGFSRIVIVDNCSKDPSTLEMLSELSENHAVTVLRDRSSVCDQARLANWGLSTLLDGGDVQWVFPCDADEFIWCGDDLEAFLRRRRVEGTLYGTLSWLNHIPESPATSDDPLSYMSGDLFYLPFSEKSWHHPNHFRKAFCHLHNGMEIVVGGHFFRREVNPAFFSTLGDGPADLQEGEGVIFHYEMRDCAAALLRKWRDLAERHVTSGVRRDGPWREKEEWMGVLRNRYEGQERNLFVDFAQARRTLWQSDIPAERLRRRGEVALSLVRAGVLPPRSVNPL